MKEDKDEDISIDSEGGDESVLAEEHQGDQVRKLKEKLKVAEDKAREYLDGWQRERAEIANARKRDEEARSEFVKFASWKVVKDLIPVLDALSLAVSHGERGVEQIQNLLLKTLKDNGVEESDPMGEEFNPELHEAIGIVETKDKKVDNKILEVMQKGYILSGKIIRPAKVKIGEYK